MKEFSTTKMYLGFQFYVHTCAKTKKEACEIFNISIHVLNTYGMSNESTHEECINSPKEIFVSFDSGEMAYIRPEWVGYGKKLIPYNEVKSFIDEHRKLYFTYNETVKDYEFMKGRKNG